MDFIGIQLTFAEVDIRRQAVAYDQLMPPILKTLLESGVVEDVFVATPNVRSASLRAYKEVQLPLD